jgi:predicted MFS family arabinose efflux permease
MTVSQIVALVFMVLILLIGTSILIQYIKESTPDPNGWSKPSAKIILTLIGDAIVLGFFIDKYMF